MTEPEIPRVKKILVIRFSSIGDIVLASPVLRCVKQQLPDCELHFLTKLSFAAVTAANPHVDRFFYYESDLPILIKELQSEEYDHVIDLQDNLRSKAVRRALKKDTHVIRKLTTQKLLLTKLNIDLMPDRHITLRSLDTVASLGVQDDGFGLDFFIPQKDKVAETDIPHAHLAGFIAIAIGANHFTKRYPIHKHIELCSRLDHPIILIGGPQDAAAGEMIAAQDPVKIYNACGKFNLGESADLVRRAKLLVSNDTGMLYIACALKRPVVALWGGTSPDLDVAPFYGTRPNKQTPRAENIVLNLRCQPCSKYGLAKCPLEHFNCMEKVAAAAVEKDVRGML